MGKKFKVGAGKSFLSLSVAYMSHIVRKEKNPNHQLLNDHPDNNDSCKDSRVFFGFLSWKLHVCFFNYWIYIET